MEKLKNCPFCGGKAFVWRTNQAVYIQCENYDATNHKVEISGENDKEAVRAWNRRTNNDSERSD